MSFAELNVPQKHVYLFKPHRKRKEGVVVHAPVAAGEFWYNIHMNDNFITRWYSSPVLWFVFVAALLVTWAMMDPGALVNAFDQDGRSPFELATLPFFAAIVPLVWWECPFTGS